MSINRKEFIWFGKNLFCSDFDEFSRWLANMFFLIAAAVLSIAYAEQGEKDDDFLFNRLVSEIDKNTAAKAWKKTVEVEFSSIFLVAFQDPQRIGIF